MHQPTHTLLTLVFAQVDAVPVAIRVLSNLGHQEVVWVGSCGGSSNGQVLINISHQKVGWSGSSSGSINGQVLSSILISVIRK